MLNFDLCFAACHCQSRLSGCLAALANANYDLHGLHLYFADNASTDGTLQQLQQLQDIYQNTFGSFTILPQTHHNGFGAAGNAAANAGTSPFVLFLDVDTEVFPDAFLELEKAVKRSGDSFAGFELRQFPCEHPKYYDPVTLETDWCNGACMAVRRDVLKKAGGFDETIPMPCEDIELSWHIRALGYKLRYVPGACIRHHTDPRSGEHNRRQLVCSALGDLVLRLKYGSRKQIAQWEKAVCATLEKISQDPFQQQLLESGLRRIKSSRRSYRNFYRTQVRNSNFTPGFAGESFSFMRSGSLCKLQPCSAAVPITVIVRTFRRPEVLRLTLESLRWQTYLHFRVIVVEDGAQPVSRSVVQQAADWLDITYFAANAPWGRSRAGNEGVALAQTEYVCFLDDDDYFFADHLETMAGLIEQNPACGMFCAGSVLGRCAQAADETLPVPFRSLENLSKEKLTAFDFFTDNPVPIQAVVFRKDLYQQCGGMDIRLNALEDWDLWMRMACRTSIAATAKATSIFRVPDDPQQFAKRHADICRYRETVYQKMADYQTSVTAQQAYRLFWRPEYHEAEILEKAMELRNSGTWRATRWLRAAIQRWLCGLQRFAGPADVDLQGKSAEELHRYCEQLQSSFCWRFLHDLRTLPQKLKTRKP